MQKKYKSYFSQEPGISAWNVYSADMVRANKVFKEVRKIKVFGKLFVFLQYAGALNTTGNFCF